MAEKTVTPKPRKNTGEEPEMHVTTENYFKSEMDYMDTKKIESDELYEDARRFFSNIKGNGNSFMRVSIKDMSEFLRTMSGITSTSIDASNKKSMIMKNLADIQLKKLNANKDDQDMTDLARSLISELKVENKKDNINKTVRYEKYNQKEDENMEALMEKAIMDDIESGDIKITKNDKAMKYDYEGVDYKYEQDSGTIKAFNKSGELLEDYPDERIPSELKNISKVADGRAITKDGTNIPLFTREESQGDN